MKGIKLFSSMSYCRIKLTNAKVNYLWLQQSVKQTKIWLIIYNSIVLDKSPCQQKYINKPIA